MLSLLDRAVIYLFIGTLVMCCVLLSQPSVIVPDDFNVEVVCNDQGCEDQMEEWYEISSTSL